jgi:hypothetical protein
MYTKAMQAVDRHQLELFTQFLARKKQGQKNKKIPYTAADYHYGYQYWHYLYARSFGMQQGLLSKESGVLADFKKEAIAQAKKNYSNASVYEQLLMSLTLYRYGEKELATQIMTGLEQIAVKSEERGMYWKSQATSWYWHQSDVATQSLAVEAFAEIMKDNESVEELKIWLIRNKRTNRWKSTKATALAAYALLLNGQNYTTIQENQRILWGQKQLKETDIPSKEAGSGYFKISKSGAEITKDLAQVTVENKSKTTGYGGLYWQYFEDLDKIEVDNDLPFALSKKLFKKIKTDAGDRLEEITADEPIKVGDVLTVRLVLTTTDRMEFVHLKDMRASGFEPVDVLSKYRWQDGLGYYQSTKDVATHFFYWFDAQRDLRLCV